jgi:hypothetical protein
MKPGGAKTKGKRFETQIANAIHEKLYRDVEQYRNLYDSCNNENLKPKRDSSSGTFTTSTGDIELGLAQQFFPYSIECKHHKDLNLSIDSMFSNKWKKLQDIYNGQCVPVAMQKRLEPMVVFKGNRTGSYVLLNCHSVKEVTMNAVLRIGNRIQIEDWHIVSFSQFLDSYVNTVTETKAV